MKSSVIPHVHHKTDSTLGPLPLLKLAEAPLSSNSLAMSWSARLTAHIRGVHSKASLVSTSTPVHSKEKGCGGAYWMTCHLHSDSTH